MLSTTPSKKSRDYPLYVRGLSGYQLFILEMTPLITDKRSSKDRMMAIIKMWRALSEKEKAEWHSKALISPRVYSL